MSRALSISIVVPAFNEAGGLAASLASIRFAASAFDACGTTWELIVCDNNSTDATAAIARQAGARVVFEPVNQISRARNAGAAQATGEWLLFIDADSHPSPGLFADVVDAISSGRYVAGGATVAVDSTERLSRSLVRTWNAASRLFRIAAGSFLFCEARAFRDAGGFSLELFATEELDLFKRLKRVGRRTRRRTVVLSEYPLLTSNRKARLYSKREIARSMLKVILTRGRTLKSRDECYVWYDGRRE